MGCSEPDISSHPQEESDYNELPTSFRLDIDVQRDCRSSKDSSAERSPVEHDSPRECQSPKGSSFEKRLVVIDTEHEYQSPISSAIDKNQVEIDCEECETPKFYSVSKFEMDVDGEQELQRPNVPCADVPGAGMAMKGEEYIYVVPQIGVEFESEDHAYNCYSRYAVLEGFSIRKDFVNKSRTNGIVVSRRYTCYRQGYRHLEICDIYGTPDFKAVNNFIYQKASVSGKTLLSLISIFFDLLFMGQHYVLYHGKKAVITPKIISKESSEPLIKSSDDPV